VLSTPEPTPSELQEIKQAPVKAVTPSGEEIEVTEVIVTQPVAANAVPSSLPKTGSLLPLLGLGGLLALAGSCASRAVVRKIS